MAIAIREIDLASGFKTLSSIRGYKRCMVVLRWRRRIVGRAFLPVVDGSIPEAALLRSAQRIGPDAWGAWLHETLRYDDRDMVGATLPSATIAICTRERPDDLDRALEGIARQTHSGHEVLVVDNAPRTERTRRVVERHRGVRYICEPTAGLNVARNRALREAAGEVVAFTDDDATPEPEWLDNLLRNFGDPRVLCVTGVTLPIELETDAQELFEEFSPFARGFYRRVFDGQHDSTVAVGPVGAGANMAVRREAMTALGMFDERLDGGMPTRSGGDHEIFVRILSAGYRIVYDPAAVSWHRHRRTHQEVVDTIYGYGVGVYAMWTGLLVERGELGVLRLAWSWFRGAHLRELRRMLLRRPATRTGELTRAELRGCLHGPRAWFAARRLRTAGGPLR